MHNKKKKDALKVFELGIVRKIYGLVAVNEEKGRMNQETKKILQLEKILRITK